MVVQFLFIVSCYLYSFAPDPHGHAFQIKKKKDGSTKVNIPVQFMLETGSSTESGRPRTTGSGGGRTPTVAGGAGGNGGGGGSHEEVPYIMNGGFKMNKPHHAVAVSKSMNKLPPPSTSSFLPEVPQ